MAGLSNSYFVEVAAFAFRDCQDPASNPTVDAALAAVLAFVKRRRFTPTDLRHQILMTQDDRIEVLLAGDDIAEESICTGSCSAVLSPGPPKLLVLRGFEPSVT